MRPITFLDSAETRAEVLKGIKDLAELVGKTLGPGGRPILLEQENRAPLTTKDGVTVARNYAAPTPIQRVVVDAAREVCERTVRQVGDGTTTAITLAAAIVEAGQEWLQKNPKVSPQEMSRKLKELFVKEIKPQILALARPIKNLPASEAQQVIRYVALVSANFDDEIADAVSQAQRHVGEDGMIAIEEGTGAETKVVHQAGFPVASGLRDLGGAASSAFVNRKAYGDAVVEGAYIIMYDGDLENVETIAPLLQLIAMETNEKGQYLKTPTVVVAHRFGDMVLKFMAQNFRSGALTIAPVVTPRNGMSIGRQQFLYDLASYVGGQVFDPVSNPLKEGNPGMLGFAEEVNVGLSETFFKTEPEQDAVEKRIAELKEQMDQAPADFDKDRYRYSIGRLTGGIATIYAGGSTALEARERHARVVDAVSASRSAMVYGVAPGGGATLLQISRGFAGTDAQAILAKALKKPFVQILLNAGIANNEEEALTIGNGVGKVDGEFRVYDALKRESVEFWQSGIFDPAAVTISALENALSVAQLLMTLGGVVAISMSDGEAQAKAMTEHLAKAVTNGDLE